MADPESLTRSISEAVSRAVSETVSAVFAQVCNQPKLHLFEIMMKLIVCYHLAYVVLMSNRELGTRRTPA